MRRNLSKTLISRGVSAAIASLALQGGAVMAQGGPQLEEVVVTGSRIAGDPNLVSSTPVQAISEEAIRLSGELNLADVVNDIPALVSSITAENSLTGANELNLRGLGGERTLTLVNGRRHVAGFRGTQAVDIGTIPRALVKSVEVTTGGASAVYGADAVTGVVNFVLRDDFEGFRVDLRGGVPEESGGDNYSLDAIFGRNFQDGRGNVVLAVSYEDDSTVEFGQRKWSRDNGVSSVGPNGNPDPNGPPRAVVDDAGFWLSSQEGSIAPTFGGRETTYVDINQNGIADCQESEGGRVGFLAGCWLTNPDGSVRVNQDGTVINGLWGTGGDASRLNFNRDALFPETDRFVVNFNGRYDFTDNLRGYFEAKYVNGESTIFTEQDTFYDTLFILPDNPFIPGQLAPVVEQTGGLLLTQDPLDFSDNNPFVYTRETTRFVGGFEWEFSESHRVDVSANYGRFEQTDEETGLYLDRVFAAIDTTTGPGGNAVCRSDIDPTAAYEIDYFAAGNGFADGGFSSDRYYTFTPGDGQCAPLNPFGRYSASPEAQDFVTANLEDTTTIEQTVISAVFSGKFEFDFLDVVLDGPIGYAAGIEYREESSDTKLDPLRLGILPQGTSFTPGAPVSSVDPYVTSFIGWDNVEQFNSGGSYDVTDLFVEVRLPILQDRFLARELTLDGAIRVADYSTLGDATTWKVGASWTPVDMVSFRGTVSEAVRAPNITELFDPRLPITVNATEDPCDVTTVGTGTAARQANCVASLQAAGVAQSEILDASGNYVWTNPLTARFNGVSGGNPDLDVETAETYTIGAVFQPLDGLSITIDYWDVTIENAIGAVGARDILTGCFDSGNFPNLEFCNLFSRRGDGGLNFLETGQINFANLEASGIDFAINYDLLVGENTFGISLVGSKQEALDRFFNPADSSDVNPELEEVQVPEWSANLNLSYDRGPLSVSLQTLYMSRQAVDEIEDVLGLNGNQPLYGDAGFFDEVFIHDANVTYMLNDEISLYAGINNITDEEPFATQTAWPVGPRGRTYFLGLTYQR